MKTRRDANRQSADMTWTAAMGKAGLWGLPNVLVIAGLAGLFITGEADYWNLPMEGILAVLVPVSWLCALAIPVAAGRVHRSRRVAIVAALCEAALATVVTGVYVVGLLIPTFPAGFHA